MDDTIILNEILAQLAEAVEYTDCTSAEYNLQPVS